MKIPVWMLGQIGRTTKDENLPIWYVPAQILVRYANRFNKASAVYKNPQFTISLSDDVLTITE